MVGMESGWGVGRGLLGSGWFDAWEGLGGIFRSKGVDIPRRGGMSYHYFQYLQPQLHFTK